MNTKGGAKTDLHVFADTMDIPQYRDIEVSNVVPWLAPSNHPIPSIIEL